MNKSNIFDNCTVISNNPRYTVIPRIDTNLFDLFSEKTKSEDEVVIELLSNEGDLKDFLNLIKSISKKFDSQLNKIFYIQKNGINFIIEGNRRIIAAKLLIGKIDLPDLSKLNIINSVDNFNYFNYDIDDEINYSEQNTAIIMGKNYSNILKIIKEFKEINRIENLIDDNAFEEVKSSDEIWKIVYARHISGNQIGKRSWSRSIYLLSLLNFFSDSEILDNKESQELMEEKLQKKYNLILADYFQAIWVLNIFATSNPGMSKGKLESEIKISKVSTLQTNFCFGIFNYILSKTPEYQEYKIFSKNSKEKSIFKYIHSESLKKQKIVIQDDNFWDSEKFNKVIVFIYRLFKEKKITTRTNIRNQYELNTRREAEFILFEKDSSEEITLNNVYHKLEYITADNLEENIKIISKNIYESEKTEIKNIFKTSLINIEMISKLIDSIKFGKENLKKILGEFYYTFNKLVKELLNNSKDNNINVCFYLVRSILELLIYKAFYTDSSLFDTLPDKIIGRITETVKQIKKDKESIFNNPFNEGKFELFKLFEITKTNFLINTEKNNLTKFVKAINPDIPQNNLNNIFEKLSKTSNGDHFIHLGALIHCFHQYFNSSSFIYKEVLNSSRVILELIIDILSF